MAKGAPPAAAAPQARATVRLDKWLWQARFFKTRSLATREVQAGHVRLNARRVSKPAHPVGVGDTLTFPQGNRIRVIRLVALGLRRGSAPEAQRLYDDLEAPAAASAPPAAAPDGPGQGAGAADPPPPPRAESFRPPPA